MRIRVSSSLAHVLRIASFVAAAATAQAQVYRETDLGTQPLEAFARSLANAGDVDGDGIDDFIVGAPYYSTATLTSAGHAIVYSGATGAQIREHVGAGNQDYLGTSVAAAGDVDGDGVPDYVVGSPGYTLNQTHCGLVVVYSGSDGSTLWSRYGTSNNGQLGWSVAGIGDVDGDGLGDVVVGSRNDEVFVYESDGSSRFHIIHGVSFGFSVAGCGDVDGDGVPDFAVGEPLENSTAPSVQDCGAVNVRSGANGATIYRVFGTSAFDELGLTLARLDDLDGDGVGDFIAGGMTSDTNGTDAGIVRVVSGATGATIREQTGTFTGDRFGSCVGGLGDVDLDGVPDYAVGARDAGVGNAGRLRICSGADGSTIHEFAGGSASYDLGSSVAGGDWNGDGVGDLLAGDDFEYDASGTKVGGVAVVLMCPAWQATYGPGWPGKYGVPTLVAQEKPVVGHALDVDLSNSRGLTTAALLLIGVAPANVPIHNSGTLLVSPLLSVPLSVPAAGTTLSGTLPSDPALYFFDLYLQALEVDPFASKGMSFTAGLQLHCGIDLP